jgi:hypothetical protein
VPRCCCNRHGKCSPLPRGGARAVLLVVAAVIRCSDEVLAAQVPHHGTAFPLWPPRRNLTAAAD